VADADRRDALRAGLRQVTTRIATACDSVGRDPAEIRLIAITKGFPATDIAVLAELGVADIGENRDQEARAKVAQVNAILDRDRRLRWHFVGQLQTNKCRSVAGYADAVHSVDRAQLVAALDTAAHRHARRLDVFVQVSLDDDPNRGGASADEAVLLADQIALADELDLVGVMAVAPIAADVDAAFARLRDVSEQVRAHHSSARAISAGMSDDLEAAIRQGATHLRVGSALLGRRRP
jgi:PLP dependent protein